MDVFVGHSGICLIFDYVARYQCHLNIHKFSWSCLYFSSSIFLCPLLTLSFTRSLICSFFPLSTFAHSFQFPRLLLFLLGLLHMFIVVIFFVFISYVTLLLSCCKWSYRVTHLRPNNRYR